MYSAGARTARDDQRLSALASARRAGRAGRDWLARLRRGANKMYIKINFVMNKVTRRRS